MDLKISIKVPDWDPNPGKTTTNNHNWRRCVIVEFPNCDFKWIPTYKQLAQIEKALRDAELINQTIAADNKLKIFENTLE